MSVFSDLGNRAAIGNLGAIPKSNSAYKILQAPKYKDMGDISWQTGETWGVLIGGAAIGLVTVLLFNRYYK
ncbi:MAG: hypothetical protein EB156_05280 [Euryarchaeota archaeon]|nr:hypothetical protein [Euryarchaeota archaeon]NDG22026.1 hypothetical protein [Euryarchaeota archaeon]